MKPGYEPKDLDGNLTHLMEECAEVIKEVCKIQRFGLDNRNPDDPGAPTNREALLSEMADLERRMSAVRLHIAPDVKKVCETCGNRCMDMDMDPYCSAVNKVFGLRLSAGKPQECGHDSKLWVPDMRGK